MDDLAGKSSPCLRYCYAILAECLPEKVLRADDSMRRLAKAGGKCFALVLRRTSWDTFVVCVAVDAHHLRNEKLSHLVEVPASALPPGASFDSLAAAAIPANLLEEDAELRHAAEVQGVCPALIEHRLDWDLYRVRVAPDIPGLGDVSRSHVIYLSQAEVQTSMGYPIEEVQPVAAPEASERLPAALLEEETGLKRLVSVQVPQDELVVGAVELGILSPSLAVLPRRGSPSWQRFSRQLKMALYRILLRSISHRRALRKKLCRAFWMGRRLGRWLIEIRASPIEDWPGYWCLRACIPARYA